MSEKQVKIGTETVVEGKASETGAVDSMKMGRNERQDQETRGGHYPKTTLSPMELEYALARPV